MPKGYCVKCKAEKPIVEAVEETLKNGRKALKGKCPACGTVISTRAEPAPDGEPMSLRTISILYGIVLGALGLLLYSPLLVKIVLFCIAALLFLAAVAGMDDQWKRRRASIPTHLHLPIKLAYALLWFLPILIAVLTLQDWTEIRQRRQLARMRSEQTQLRETFRQGLPVALDHTKQRRYAEARPLLQQARSILSQPPVSSPLSSQSAFMEELSQVRMCVAATAVLEGIEMLERKEIAEPEMDECLSMARRFLTSGDSGDLVQKWASRLPSQSKSAGQALLSGYTLLKNTEWTAAAFSEYKTLGPTSFRKFMMTDVAFRASGSPAPPGSKRIDYNTEIESLWANVLRPARSANAVLVVVLANHLGVVLGERQVNSWQYGWQSNPLQRKYTRNYRTVFVDPWGSFSDFAELEATLRVKFDYDLYERFR